MADPRNRFPEAVQYMRSPVFVGIAVAAISHILAMFGKHIPDDQIKTLVGNATDILTSLSLLYAGYKRWISPVQPLASTKAKAEVKAEAIKSDAGPPTVAIDRSFLPVQSFGAMKMSANVLILPAKLGALVLKWGTAKYIESAGATSAEMLARAQTVKTLASAADGVALGSMSLQQLATATAAELATGKSTVSNQLLVNGLVDLIGNAVPTGTLLTAALGAEADVFLKDVIAVCATFGA